MFSFVTLALYYVGNLNKRKDSASCVLSNENNFDITKSSSQCSYLQIKNGFSLKATNSNTGPSNSKVQTWRVYNVDVLYENDPGKDSVVAHEKLMESIIQTLKSRSSWKPTNLNIVKKAFDGRWKKFGQPKWVYTVDIEIPLNIIKQIGLKEFPGKFEKMIPTKLLTTSSLNAETSVSSSPKIVIVGAGKYK